MKTVMCPLVSIVTCTRKVIIRLSLDPGLMNINFAVCVTENCGVTLLLELECLVCCAAY